MNLTHTYRSTATVSAAARRVALWAALAACAFALLAAPSAASAADTTVAADPAADEVAALDGAVVWTSGPFGNQVLMTRSSTGVIARVMGAPGAARYSSLDLGHDSKGKLVLTYERCNQQSCRAIRDNLRGQRASFRNLTLTRCTLTTAPAVWGTRLAYGQNCRKPNRQIDEKRSGLYVKTGAGSPKRLRLPSDAVRFHITDITAVDLRSTRVAAVVADVYESAFTQTVSGTGMRSIFAAASEGESNEHAMGVSLGSGGAMWTLVNAEHSGDPNRANIFRVSATCYRLESLINPAGPSQHDGFLAGDLAVDGTTLYLVVPGTGIVKHDFAPRDGCTKL